MHWHALYGLGGVGKTELALAFANKHKDRFSLICWIDAETKTGLESAYREIARWLEIKLNDSASPKEIRTAVFTKLENYNPKNSS